MIFHVSVLTDGGTGMVPTELCKPCQADCSADCEKWLQKRLRLLRPEYAVCDNQPVGTPAEGRRRGQRHTRASESIPHQSRLTRSSVSLPTKRACAPDRRSNRWQYALCVSAISVLCV